MYIHDGITTLENVIGADGQFRRKILIKGLLFDASLEFHELVTKNPTNCVSFSTISTVINFMVSTGYRRDRSLCEAHARYVQVDIFANARHFNSPRGGNKKILRITNFSKESSQEFEILKSACSKREAAIILQRKTIFFRCRKFCDHTQKHILILCKILYIGFKKIFLKLKGK